MLRKLALLRNQPFVPKLAFLFLTIDNLKHDQIWTEFFHNIDPSRYTIYCHPKHPDRIHPHSVLHGHVIPNLVATSWGDISCVIATVNMLECALGDRDNMRFILLSDSCIPLYSFDRTLSELGFPKENSDDIYKDVVGSKARIDYFPDKPGSSRWATLANKTFIPKNRMLKQAFWMSFDRQMANYFVGHRYFDAFAGFWNADEHYFINVLIRDRPDDVNKWVDNRSLTYANWDSGGAHPKTYSTVSTADVDEARRLGNLFFRKVDWGANLPIAYILQR
jgi:hypothetical protein